MLCLSRGEAFMSAVGKASKMSAIWDFDELRERHRCCRGPIPHSRVWRRVLSPRPPCSAMVRESYSPRLPLNTGEGREPFPRFNVFSWGTHSNRTWHLSSAGHGRYLKSGRRHVGVRGGGCRSASRLLTSRWRRREWLRTAGA